MITSINTPPIIFNEVNPLDFSEYGEVMFNIEIDLRTKVLKDHIEKLEKIVSDLLTRDTVR